MKGLRWLLGLSGDDSPESAARPPRAEFKVSPGLVHAVIENDRAAVAVHDALVDAILDVHQRGRRRDPQH